MITVVTPADSRSLITLDRAKLEIGLGLADASQDDRLNALIAEVSDEVESECGCVFAKEVVTETLLGTGRVRLILDRRPILAVSAVRFDGAALDPSEYAIEESYSGFLYRSARWVEERFLAGVAQTGLTPEPGRRLWEVDYTGGYWLSTFTGNPGTTDVKLPRALESIVAAFVALRYFGAGSGANANLQSYSIGDYSETRADASEVRDTLFRRLDPFRRIAA